jgi:hypothetical protein
MKRPLIILVLLCLVLVATVSAAAAPNRQTDECTWGASSVIVEHVNGQYVQSESATSGCIPG